MSLNWNVNRVANHEEITAEGEWSKTETMIFLTMLLGMPEITAKNAEEFAIRLDIYTRLHGDVGAPLTRDDITRRVGLSTNASRETRARWLKRITPRARA